MNFIFCKREATPLYTSRAHTHDVWEIILNYKGESDDIIGGESFHLDTRSLVCIPPNVLHEKRAENGFCDFAILCKSLALPDNGRATVISDDSEGSAAALINIINTVYHKKEEGYKEICENLFSALEQMILTESAHKKKAPIVEELINIMVNEFNNPDFSLATLSEKSGYCSDHVRRIFRRDTGMTTLEYLTSLRINSAKKLLRENRSFGYTVAQISVMSGFDDIGYFSRVFRKKTGLSPSEYMKKYM